MQLRRNVPLAPSTSLKIGGPAEYLVEATTREEVAEALHEAQRRGLAVTPLGGGANVLVADEGIRGLVVFVRIRGMRREGNRLIVGAGTPMADVVARSVTEGLSGLAWAGGLPGTVGGAVFGNAGTFGHAIGDSIESVDVVLPDGSERTIVQRDCAFGYRQSVFQTGMFAGAVIVGATLRLAAGDPDVLRKEMMDAIAFRIAHHPAPSSAGSFFKNPDAQPLGVPVRGETVSVTRDGSLHEWFGRVPAGWLIDRAGLKGARVGGAVVSEKHANFVINSGNATAKDVRALAQVVKDRVREHFGVMLEEEVRYLR